MKFAFISEEKSKEEFQQRWRINYEDIILNSELGRGTFGVVYLATWKNKQVAGNKWSQSINHHSLLIIEIVKHMLAGELTQKEIDDFLAEIRLMR